MLTLMTPSSLLGLPTGPTPGWLARLPSGPSLADDTTGQTPVPDAVCPDEGGLCDLVYRTTDNEWLAKASDWLIAKPAAILLLIIIAVIIRWLLHRMIDRVTTKAAVGTVPAVLPLGKRGASDPQRELTERRRQRAETMGSLLKSVTTGIILAVVVFMGVAQLGYNIAPLIASAGIIGIALGFGAQSLVKDFISGVFMIMEDQYGVGDVVNVGPAVGTIEAVGLRVTRLRDVDGTVWYVPNGEITAVGNMSQNWARTVLDIPVGYGEDLDRVREILHEVADELWDDKEYRRLILEAPEVWGVERWEPDGVVVRVVLKTAPLEQWGVAREMRERIKERFDAEGIEIPVPQRAVWLRDGASPEAPGDANDPGSDTTGADASDTPPGTAPGTGSARGRPE